MVSCADSAQGVGLRLGAGGSHVSELAGQLSPDPGVMLGGK